MDEISKISFFNYSHEYFGFSKGICIENCLCSEMNTYIFFILFLSSTLTEADEVSVAGTEDLKQFDEILENQLDDPESTEPKVNFGELVSEEARKMKGEDLETRKNFGQWVSSQRRKDGLHKAEGNRLEQGRSRNIRDSLPDLFEGKRPEKVKGKN